MNNIPFFEEGAEYDNAKQKFANWNNICCGCCHKHNAVLPEHDRRIIAFHKTCTTYWLHIIRKSDMQEKTNKRISLYLMRWYYMKEEGRVQVQGSCWLNRDRWVVSKKRGKRWIFNGYLFLLSMLFGLFWWNLSISSPESRGATYAFPF